MKAIWKACVSNSLLYDVSSEMALPLRMWRICRSAATADAAITTNVPIVPIAVNHSADMGCSAHQAVVVRNRWAVLTNETIVVRHSAQIPRVHAVRVTQ